MRHRTLAALFPIGASTGALTAVALTAALAHGSEPLPARAERVMAPGKSTAAEDGVESMVLAPSNLAHLPAPELRWTGVRCPDTKKVGCGHGVTFGAPLFFGLTGGLRVDYVTPPTTADFPFTGIDYTWITLGLAWKASEMVSFGTTVQRAYSTNGYIDGLWGLSSSVSVRPNTHFAFAAVAHDWNGPASTPVPPFGYPVLHRSFVGALAIRPTGRRVFEVGAEVKYLEGFDQVLPRATVGLDIPKIGRVRADVEVARLPNDNRRGVVGTAGLEIALNGMTVGAGGIFGNGLGNAASVGQYGSIGITGYRSPGIERPVRAVTMRMETTPGTRSHVALLRRLWRLAENKEIGAVTFVMRAEPASSYAHAEELADAIRLLRLRGKKVICSLEDNGAKSLYVCANADRTVVNPAGGLRYAGLRTQFFYLAGLLDKLGVKAEFVRIGAHKSAPEQFTNTEASRVAREDHEDMLRQIEAVFTRDVAVGRKLSEERVRAMTAKGPFIASEAQEAGFVDGTAFDDEVERVTQEVVGKPIHVEKYEDEVLAPDTFGPRGRVAILYVDGDMIDGRSRKIPILDNKLVGSYTIAETVKALKDDPKVRAVVLRVETPGGSSMAADVMWRELEQLGKKKPLIVSMGSVAASGGYYIASAGQTIYALPLTVTGSIGIFYGKADVSELLKKIGVNVETYRTAPRADAESIFRGFTDDERTELRKKVGQFYETFLNRVARGRNLTMAEVDASGQGHVWTGQQALQRKLVDRLGGLREALEAARQAAGLPEDAPIVEAPAADQSLLEKVLKLAGFDLKDATPIAALPPQLRDVARSLTPMAVYAGDVPLARLEWGPVDEATESE